MKHAVNYYEQQAWDQISISPGLSFSAVTQQTTRDDNMKDGCFFFIFEFGIAVPWGTAGVRWLYAGLQRCKAG